MINIAHRGASGYAPENSFTAFEKALSMGADMIELDVRTCATGELAVIHDTTLNRTTNGDGLVDRAAADDLAALDAGDGRGVPLLSQVITLVDRQIPINIELKGRGAADGAAALLSRYIDKGWRSGDFLVSSFNLWEVRRFRELLPSVEVGALLGTLPLGLAGEAEILGAQSVNPSLELVCPELIEDAHRRGMKVFVFTVNREDDLEEMHRLGVDGVFCNYPDRLRRSPHE